ncbi:MULTISPECIES: hypothetical protein [Nocardia]|nr:hypothetical protein [Nocardia sputorum]
MSDRDLWRGSLPTVSALDVAVAAVEDCRRRFVAPPVVVVGCSGTVR